MGLAFAVYLIGILPAIENVAIAFCVFSGIVWFFISFWSLLEGDGLFNFVDRHARFTYTHMGLFVVACIVAVAVPSERTMYMMAGAYATQQVYQSDEARQLGSKLVTLIDKKMEQYIDEAETAINASVDKAKDTAKKEVDKQVQKVVK